jgi:hypothetical protein
MQVPSIGFIRDDGEVIVGEASEPEGAADPSRVVREFKRRTGDPVPLVVDGSPFSAQALTARLLAWVIGIATERQGGPPEHVCVTHPANWGPVKRDLLGQAITMAGLRGAETSTRTEPEAAAIAYASRDRVAEGDRVALACSRTSSRISCANCRTRPSATSGRRRSEPRFYDINAERGTVAAISGGVLDSASGLERGPVPVEQAEESWTPLFQALVIPRPGDWHRGGPPADPKAHRLEIKILSYIAAKFAGPRTFDDSFPGDRAYPDPRGTVELYTNYRICPSCSTVVAQFHHVSTTFSRRCHSRPRHATSTQVTDRDATSAFWASGVCRSGAATAARATVAGGPRPRS